MESSKNIHSKNPSPGLVTPDEQNSQDFPHWECGAGVKTPPAFPWVCFSSHQPEYFIWIANPSSGLPTEDNI